MYIFKALEEKEKPATKPLWQHAFSEDSDAFVTEYYRGVKAGVHGHEIFAIVDDIDFSVASMLHLNKTKLMLRQGTSRQIIDSLFIVGVATSSRFRRKGFMKSLMNKAIMYAEDRKLPFIYLTAENEAVYKPFGFVTVGFQYEIDTDKEILENFLKEAHRAQISHSDVQTSQKVFDEATVTTVRDELFYAQYEKELQADDGFIVRMGDSAVCGFPSNEAPDKIIITDIYGIPDDIIDRFFTKRKVHPLMVKAITMEEDTLKNFKFNITEPY